MKMERRSEPDNGRWFPYLDVYKAASMELGSGEVIEALYPYIMEERIQRAVENRSYSVCLVVEGLTDLGMFRQRFGRGCVGDSVGSCVLERWQEKLLLVLRSKTSTGLNAAKSLESRNPKFVIPWTLSRLYHVPIPKKVAKEVGLKDDQSATLIDPVGKSWPVNIVIRSHGQVQIGSGWSHFSKATMKHSSCLTKCLLPTLSSGNEEHIGVDCKPSVVGMRRDSWAKLVAVFPYYRGWKYDLDLDIRPKDNRLCKQIDTCHAHHRVLDANEEPGHGVEGRLVTIVDGGEGGNELVGDGEHWYVLKFGVEFEVVGGEVVGVAVPLLPSNADAGEAVSSHDLREPAHPAGAHRDVLARVVAHPASLDPLDVHEAADDQMREPTCCEDHEIDGCDERGCLFKLDVMNNEAVC